MGWGGWGWGVLWLGGGEFWGVGGGVVGGVGGGAAPHLPKRRVVPEASAWPRNL